MTVVVGVDNSAASKAALRLAAQEARWRQAPLVAVTAYEAPIRPVGGYPAAAKHTEGEQRATAEADFALPSITNSATKHPKPTCAFPQDLLDA